MKVTSTKFGKTSEGKEVQLFTLTNDNNITVKITNYGCIITSIEMPDKAGKRDNVVCGFDQFDQYLSPEYLSNYPYFGAIIGRYGNRIANGDLEIEGKTYKMAINNGPNHLHGGITGFDKRIWDAKIIDNREQIGVHLTYLSPDMEENYLGNLEVDCIYTLNNKNELSIEYFAKTDKTTVLNLTNHTYFNLTGGKENILNHELKLVAKKMTEAVDLIPTGEIIPIEGTAFDFNEFKTLKKDLAELPTGYDNNFVLDNTTGDLRYTGCLKEITSGREVEIYTTQPAIQLYTGYWIPELIINGDKQFGCYSGVALETQHYPDSVHHDNFPSTELKPGEKYNHKTIYKLDVNP